MLEDSDSPANLGPSRRRGAPRPPARLSAVHGTAADGPAGLDSFLTQVARHSFPGRGRPSLLRARRAPGRARPSRARFGGTTAGGPPMRVVRRFGYPGGHGSPSPPAMAARDLGSRPPIVAEVGGLEPSVPLVACAPRAASGGRKPWAVRPRSHIVRSARPHGERYPRAKPEDDAVGAPRLVFRR